MSSTPETPNGPDLDALREQIDELEKQPIDDLVSPIPTLKNEDEPEPEPTEAIGSVEWDEPYPEQ